MGLTNAKCPRCNTIIQLESQNRVGFCSSCGGRVVTQEAIKQFMQDAKVELEQKQRQEQQERVLDRSFMKDAMVLMDHGNYETAAGMYMDVWRRDPKNSDAAWGYLRAFTKNLSAYPLKEPSDYACDEALLLFSGRMQNIDPAWQTSYYDAYAKSCAATAESVDPRVFVQLEIFRWSPQNHTFLYPISRDFDITPILEKTLWKTWVPLRDALPEERREDFMQVCEEVCQRIRDCFISGFTNLEALRNGDYSLLLGTWWLKLTTGATKIDVMNFAVNAAHLPYMEAMRCSMNYYDYHRAFSVDAKNHVVCAEYRHFPSLIGVGGDFVDGENFEPTVTLVALYDFILVLPTALYVRTALNKIPGIDRAVLYGEKCVSMPCFMRSGKKSAIQMQPMSVNLDTAEPSKKVKSCYVATAVYGDIDAPQVCALRRFRDGFLNRGAPGRRLVALYYRLSPPLARRLGHSRRLNRCVRTVLDAFVRVLERRNPHA